MWGARPAGRRSSWSIRLCGRRGAALAALDLEANLAIAADYTSRSRLGHKVDWSVSDVLDIRPLLDGPDDPRLAAGSSSVCPDCPLVAAVPPATPAPCARSASCAS